MRMDRWSRAVAGLMALTAIACGVSTTSGGPPSATETLTAEPRPSDTPQLEAACHSLLTLEEILQIMPGTNMQPGSATQLEGGGSACTFTGTNDTLMARFQVLLNTATKAEFDRISSDPSSTPVPNLGDSAYLTPTGYSILKSSTSFSLVVTASAQDPLKPAADLEQIREKWEAELIQAVLSRINS